MTGQIIRANLCLKKGMEMASLTLENSAASSIPDLVDVRYDGEQWRVTIVEAGSEVTEMFLLEHHARSFASGQRIRLHLPLEDA
jgi:hypothetical protein